MKKVNKVIATIKAIITWLTPLNFKQLIQDIKFIWR